MRVTWHCSYSGHCEPRHVSAEDDSRDQALKFSGSSSSARSPVSVRAAHAWMCGHWRASSREPNVGSFEKLLYRCRHR
jgi:hypothetical protein